MARIPGEADFSGIPSARSGRPIAREDVSPLFAGADALGQGIRQAGGAAVSVATDMAAHQEKLDAFNTEALFQQFNNAEAQRYVDATRNVPAGGAAGFAASYGAGYDERARAFMESVPEHLRPQYDARLVQMRGTFEAQGNDFEINEQIRSTGQTLDNTLNNTILPRIAAAVALPDAAAQQQALAGIVADGEALINANPYLSPIEKDAAIQAWRTRAQTAFVAGVSPDQRGDWLGTTPLNIVEQIIGVESAGDPNAANPNSTALGLGQFIDSTWYDLVSAYRPDLMQGRTREEVLALRTDPALSREMTEHYIEQNAQHLSSRGLPVTPGTIYLAHFLGPGGAEALLSVPGGTPVTELLPAGVIAANRSILEGMTAAQVIAWADRKMDSAPTTRAPLLDAIPYEERNALAADAATQVAEQNSARIAAQNNLNAQRLNNLLVGIHDGTMGAAAVLQARNDGWLSNYDDIAQVDRAMEARYGEIGDIQAALGLVNDPNYTFNPFNTEDRDAVDLAYEEMGGVGALLAPTVEGESPEDAAARQDAVARMMAMVRRTGIVPEAAMNALLGGMYSSDPATMAAAFTVLDAVYRDNPRTLTGPNGLNAEQLLRYQTYQTLAPLMTPEALMERMRPDLDPREVERRDRMIEQGRTLAAERSDEEIVNNFIQGFWGAGEAAFPEGTQMMALRDDYQTLFAERYAITGDATSAHTQALEALRQKWGVSDAGDTRRVMAYPPEQQFQPVPNSGGDGYQWMRDSIRTFVEQEVGPNAQAYWLVATDATEAALGTGDPPYQVVAIDQNGQLAVFTAGGLGADREAALTAARDEFEADRQRAQPQVDAMQAYQAELNRIAAERNGGAIDGAEAGRQAQAALAALNAALEGSGAPPVTADEAMQELSPGTLRPPSIRPLGIGPSGVLMQFEPARQDMPPPPPTAAERGAQAEPPPVPVQNDVPDGYVRLLGGAIVPRANAAKQVTDRIKDRLETPAPTLREPKDEAAGMMQRAIAARKRMLAEQAANPALAPRVPQSPPQIPASTSTAASSPAAIVSPPPTPPNIRRAPASIGIRRPDEGASMDYATMPVMNPLPRVAGNIQPGNVAGYPRPTTAPTVAVDRRPLPPVQPPQPPREFVPPVMATPAIRDRNIGSMTLAELDWFLDYGDPSPEELRRMSIRANLLREQAEVNVIVTGAMR